VASTTLSALVPAWLAAGRGSEELWGSLLAALPGLPAHRRLGLLESLLTALPEVSVCGCFWRDVCCVLAGYIERVSSPAVRCAHVVSWQARDGGYGVDFGCFIVCWSCGGGLDTQVLLLLVDDTTR
jgi:hypothetical protein